MALDRLPRLDDDGLALPEVGAWAETKYRLIASVCEMFATSMKRRWDVRAYVDLFAGAGRARIKGTSLIVPTSAMLALAVRDPFDAYVLCDIDPSRLAALEQRARREMPEQRPRFVLGDCNENVARILAEIPAPQSGRRVLALCVVDPYGLAGLRFSTISALAERFMDFLVLIPSYMDANRNRDLYLEPASRTLDDFLGDNAWRSAWRDASLGPGPREFGAFVVDRFGRAMRGLGYLYDGPGEEVPVRDKHLLLYHLCFFSRNELGRKFWREARRYGLDQLGLFS